MKLERRARGRWVLRLLPQEKMLMLAVLPRYPLLPPEFHRLTKDEAHAAKLNHASQLLVEAHDKQRQQHRQAVQTFLEDASRFTEDEDGALLSLGDDEVEWLLQVLNDIRMGSWARLGYPQQREDGHYQSVENLSKKNALDMLSIELCGALQQQLLEILHPTD
ncbi:MAG: hypothetical protein EXS22_03305 [Pedosphaera sp.]|nr:hypothetical protein [Pedosphaera sp.]MSU43052.1 hypothetical protein [Pedosphaera sp.]